MEPRRWLLSRSRSTFQHTFGFFLILQLSQKDFDYKCNGPVPGFKLVLHSPDELPQVSKYFYRVLLDQEVSISVLPKMVTTKDPNLRKYKPELRGCYFNSDRSLKFFKSYNQRNCELECVANFSLKQCDCVGLSMPSNQFIDYLFLLDAILEPFRPFLFFHHLKERRTLRFVVSSDNRAIERLTLENKSNIIAIVCRHAHRLATMQKFHRPTVIRIIWSSLMILIMRHSRGECVFVYY